MLNKEINLLTKNLQEFGLNPTDWYLKKETQSEYLIKNKFCAQLTLKGVTDKKKQHLNWKFVSLYSI